MKRRKREEQKEKRFVGKHLSGKGKVSSKGWVVIPKEIRDEMELRPGDEVRFVLSPPSLDMKQDRGLYTLRVSRVPEDPVELYFGMFKRRPGEPLMTDLLVEERRRENEAEEREIRAAARRRGRKNTA